MNAAGGASVQLRTVEGSEVAASLAESLHGGLPIAPMPADPVERVQAITMLQPTQPVTETDAAAVVATSGSTAAPKGVVLSRGAIRASVEATHDRLGGIGDWILALPPHYVAGLMVLARACLTGARVMPVRSDLSDLPKVARGLAERRYLSLIPAQLDRALGRPHVSEALGEANLIRRRINRDGLDEAVCRQVNDEDCVGGVVDGKTVAAVRGDAHKAQAGFKI